MSFDGSDLPRYTNVRMGSNGVGTVEYGGGASGQTCVFYMHAVHNPAKSAQEGCPIYEDQIFVRICPPGERLNIVVRPMRPEDRRIWAREWAAFQENREQRPEGTPIEQLYPDQPSVGAALRASGVHTIQQCADLSGDAIMNIMGGQRYVNDSKKYLQSAEGGAGSVKLRRELEESQRETKVLQQQLDSLRQEVENLRAGVSGGHQQVSISQAELQALIASVQQRPTYPLASQTVAPVFDPQTAQINATKAATMPKKARGRPAKPVE